MTEQDWPGARASLLQVISQDTYSELEVTEVERAFIQGAIAVLAALDSSS